MPTPGAHEAVMPSPFEPFEEGKNLRRKRPIYHHLKHTSSSVVSSSVSCFFRREGGLHLCPGLRNGRVGKGESRRLAIVHRAYPNAYEEERRGGEWLADCACPRAGLLGSAGSCGWRVEHRPGGARAPPGSHTGLGGRSDGAVCRFLSFTSFFGRFLLPSRPLSRLFICGASPGSAFGLPSGAAVWCRPLALGHGSAVPSARGCTASIALRIPGINGCACTQELADGGDAFRGGALLWPPALIPVRWLCCWKDGELARLLHVCEPLPFALRAAAQHHDGQQRARRGSVRAHVLESELGVSGARVHLAWALAAHLGRRRHGAGRTAACRTWPLCRQRAPAGT